MSSDKIPEGLLRSDEYLSLIKWPELEPVHDIVLGSRDCFVVGAGFEDRALSGLKRACEISRGFHVVLIRYLPKLIQNQEAGCREICQEKGLDIKEFVYDRERPSGIGPSLADCVSHFDRVYVDISGMSRLLIVQIIVALVQTRKDFHILYAEAEIYPPREEEYREAHTDDGPSPAFISSGIFEIVSSPDLSSVSMLGGAIRLISFPSFDPSQLSNLVQEVQPTHNNVVRGIPARKEMGWRIAAIDQLNNSTMTALQRVEVHEASTLDYRETLALILDLYKRYSSFDRIVIAPTGSKMQAVAIGIVRGVLADLQIVYPTPLEFLNPGGHTEGVEQMFHLAVSDFGLTDHQWASRTEDRRLSDC